MTGFTLCTHQPSGFLEIACFNAASVLVADSSGADRTEFCADRASGGVTPSLSALQEVKGKCKKPIHVMIRPRGGDFVYTDAEFDQMKSDIRNIMDLGGIPSGFVFGILDENREVDIERNAELVTLARPLLCTFHRAFDEIQDMEKALEDVISCGFSTILTSGGGSEAVAGADVLGSLVLNAKGRIAIMPGGGVRSTNLKLLIDKTGADWYHSSAISGSGEDADEMEIRRLKAAWLTED
ncbi:unnamed protein product [Calypogeia fissa]